MTAVEWRGVTVTRGRRTVLHDVDLHVAPGSWTSILGPNGAGKTSLIRTLVDRRGTTGRVAIGGHDLDALRPAERARLVAVVPQHPVVPPGLRVFDYVLLGRTPHLGLRCSPSLEDRRRTLAVVQRLDLDDLAERPLDSLSGGERQRAVLARAVVQETPVLVLDEPTTVLDVGHQYDVLELVAELRTERQVTVITTMHDLSIAGQFADEVAILHDGGVAAHGAPHQVLTAATIERAWGVTATTSFDEHGGLVVSVRRRRERDDRRTSGSTPDRPTDATSAEPRSPA